MRILVFGAGAVGSTLGGLLAQAGHSVSLLGRASHLSAIRQHGLHIDGIWGAHHVQTIEVAEQPEQLQSTRWDVIFLTVKSYDTPAAIEVIRPFYHHTTTIVSVQNGYGNTQQLEAAFGSGNVFGARIITGVELPRPGHVFVTVSADDVRLGPPDGDERRMPRADELARMLRHAGVPVSATNQYPQYLWAKILYNCALNPLGALLRATYGQLVHRAGTRQVIDSILNEAFDVTAAAGIRLFWQDVESYRDHFYHELIPPTEEHYPSMLRDLERRGRTEIDSLNGAVVELGTRHAIAVPINRCLAEMIKLREQTRAAEMEAERLADAAR